MNVHNYFDTCGPQDEFDKLMIRKNVGRNLWDKQKNKKEKKKVMKLVEMMIHKYPQYVNNAPGDEGRATEREKDRKK